MERGDSVTPVTFGEQRQAANLVSVELARNKFNLQWSLLSRSKDYLSSRAIISYATSSYG